MPHAIVRNKKISNTRLYNMINVFISILNWNDAASTFNCVNAVRKSIIPSNVTITLVVLDNGSNTSDWTALQQGLVNSDVTLIRLETNTGFAAGHNVVIRSAMEQKADYIWLLNNDAIVQPDTLDGLLKTMLLFPKCGVVSPLIYAHYDENVMDFVGAVQDWSKLDSWRAGDPVAAEKMQTNHPNDFFVYGTAPFFKILAIKDSGLLDEKLFAYYEDEEICVRLSKFGWTSKMAFSVKIQHFQRRSALDERPAYYFYLMTRNALFFYIRHTPSAFSHLIRLRLFGRAMIKAAQLRERGLPDKSNACLMGIWDGLRGLGGPPRTNIKAPAWLVLTSKIFPYRLHQWLEKV
jgi:GT2 family glycosyltransferase